MKDVVQSVDRALSIIEVLSDYEEGLGITEISGKINLHKSTVYRLLSTLIYKGYVRQDDKNNKYKLSLKLFELGNKKIENTDILIIAKPYLKDLMEEVNEVVHLVLLEGEDIVYIDKVESHNTIRMHSNIGKRTPAYCTSVGKSIMAYFPENKVKEIWDNSDIKNLTEYTITDFNEFKEELKKVKRVNYAIDDEENELGVRCIGAPVFDYKGEPVAAISISGPTIRVTKDRVEEISQEVIKYSKMISKELGYKE
ncbi:IclR family transcriptional regulator [Clostridium sp. D2Q-11]|uniref:Glycerol operon regulatory protein n=1 Tax=Anaeromonas frigoriresistens TaxID=2683708 RepID=A0A942UYI1_9FIRM|nr:IclR family transcriptional regulator [Anaeromonas frigoriresistens]MBS4538666.1 IclR family transcriptional regulator [Anaeromonas frigoriresistens]